MCIRTTCSALGNCTHFIFIFILSNILWSTVAAVSVATQSSHDSVSLFLVEEQLCSYQEFQTAVLSWGHVSETFSDNEKSACKMVKVVVAFFALFLGTLFNRNQNNYWILFCVFKAWAEYFWKIPIKQENFSVSKIYIELTFTLLYLQTK